MTRNHRSLQKSSFFAGVVGLGIAASFVCKPVGAKAEDRKTSSANSPATGQHAPTSDEKVVFEALDLRLPELAAVAAAVRAGDYAAASREWAKHLRNRSGFVWGGKDAPVPKGFNAAVADGAVAGKVSGGNVPLVHAFPDGKIDWHYNATGHSPDQPLNAEWQQQLNRMQFWPEMARAYQVTGDDRYPRAFASQLHGWIEQCPVPDSVQNEVGSCWRTIECGIRLSWTWPGTFFVLLKSPALSDADIVAYTRSSIDQARYLRRFPTDVNWLLMEMNGLATTGCFFPELREAGEWRTHAFGALAAEMKRQFLPDGGHFELSTGYGPDVALPNFLGAKNVAAWTGRENELPAGYAAGLEKAFEWVMDLTTPDRGRPKTNDAWPGRVEQTLKPAVALFPQRQDFLWFVSDGKSGAPPRQTSQFLDWSGFAVMRSGWQPDANYLLFDVGPLGYGGHMGMGHSHQDKLNVVLWAYGREILYDNGGGSYRWDKWRVWSRSSLSHNCVLVDGLGQDRGDFSASANLATNPDMVSQEPIRAGWQSTPQADGAAGVYDEEYGTYGYTNEHNRVDGIYDPAVGPQSRRIARQRRSVLFLKPDVFVVADTMTPLDTGVHTYQARWQLMTPDVAQDARTLGVATQDPAVPNLAVVPLFCEGLEVRHVSAQETPEILGWNCRKDEVPERTPATTVLHTRQGSGTQRFLTLLLPLRPGQASPVASVRREGQEIDVRLGDNRHLRVSMTDDGGSRVTEILANGRPGRSAQNLPLK